VNIDNDSQSNYAKIIVARDYDNVAHEYACLEGGPVWPRMKWPHTVLDRLESGTSVPDLGCGSGDLVDIEISIHHHVTGVDISRAQIELARVSVLGSEFIQADLGSL
jgi:ubiquinone/menaquinone biosynthesis C-methylase UbiE